jgi:acetyl/propionyl-CoA carboxylase alpha subunit
MEALGDKIESKKIANKHGVNTIPGFVGEITSDQVRPPPDDECELFVCLARIASS